MRLRLTWAGDLGRGTGPDIPQERVRRRSRADEGHGVVEGELVEMVSVGRAGKARWRRIEGEGLAVVRQGVLRGRPLALLLPTGACWYTTDLQQVDLAADGWPDCIYSQASRYRVEWVRG